MNYLRNYYFKISHIYLLFGIFITAIPILKAQTPSDAIMMEGKRICIAATFGQDKFDEYWEGTLLRKNGNFGTLTRNSYGLMVAAGITNRINLIASLPYITTEPSGGQMKGASGIQDLGLWAKVEAIKKQLGPGAFTTHVVLGFTTPMSNYLPDYAPFNLGLGCAEGQGRLALQYLFDLGIYARLTAAYLLRGTSTIERNYYYTSEGYYSNEVDVPNATHLTGTLGCWFFDKSLKVEGSYEQFNTLKGHDIRRQDAGFISNKMEASSIQFGAQYYTKAINGLGVLVNYSQTLEGRNVGKNSGFLVGITYQFSISKSNNSQQ
ncbi:MAG: transporter [Saprospiraceae bacterium]|nr:transporter [Saprospiraceae bacterium]